MPCGYPASGRTIWGAGCDHQRRDAGLASGSPSQIKPHRSSGDSRYGRGHLSIRSDPDLRSRQRQDRKRDRDCRKEPEPGLALQSGGTAPQDLQRDYGRQNVKIGENSTAEQYVTEAGRFWEEGDGLIDAHAHIGTEEEIRERIRDGIPSVICVGSPKEAEQLKRLFNRFEVHPVIIPAAGLHPWNSDKYRAEEMFLFMEEWPVMGEIGLDSLWCDVPLNVQKEAFECQLDFAVKKRKPVVLHTKEQEAEIAGILRRYPNRYLVHWYSCGQHLEEYLDQDCYVSIGPDVVWNPAVQEAARQVPEDRLLIETDGLGAVKWAWEEGEKHGIMESQFHTALPELTVRSSLEQTLREVSRLRGVEMNVLAKAIKRNFRRFVWGDNTGQKEENR
ncbi:MAG: TatD family deoxyribonuclease [Clostridium sp.]|nr:TatD family deoxyribonuclease [Clostridium sp.]